MHPLLLRELLSAARSPANAWIRSFAAATLLFAVFTVFSNPFLAGIPSRGHFRGLQLINLALLWLITPILACDSISREKREGTLPLLFLTRLTAGEVILAKASLHVIRAASMLVASFPVLLVPVLHGGVTVLDALRMFILQVAALLLAVGGSLLTSSIATGWIATRLLAFSSALASALSFVALYKLVHAAWYFFQLTPQQKTQFPIPRILAIEWHTLQWQLPPSRGFWTTGAYSSSRFSDVLVAVLFLLFAAISFFAAARLATRWLEKTWTSPPPTHTQLSLLARLNHLPFLRRARSEKSTQQLSDQPLFWQQITPLSFRLARVGWCALALCFTLFASLASPHPVVPFFYLPLLLVGMVAASAGSFRKEIETGALELLLVSPISPAKIVLDRWRALLHQFTPAFVGATVLTLAIVNYRASQPTGPASGMESPILVVLIAALFLVTAALVGIALALARLSYAGAVALTLVLAALLPTALLGITWEIGGLVKGVVFAAIAQSINLWLAWRFSTQHLATRKYLEPIRPPTPTSTSTSASTPAHAHSPQSLPHPP